MVDLINIEVDCRTIITGKEIAIIYWMYSFINLLKLLSLHNANKPKELMFSLLFSRFIIPNAHFCLDVYVDFGHYIWYKTIVYSII